MPKITQSQKRRATTLFNRIKRDALVATDRTACRLALGCDTLTAKETWQLLQAITESCRGLEKIVGKEMPRD